MKIFKRISGALLAALMLAAALAVPAAAAGAINTNQAVSLTIQNYHDKVKLDGVKFKVYQVSTVESSGELTPLPAFSAYADELDIRGQNDSAWSTIAQELETAITVGTVKVLPSATAVTNSEGNAVFTGLKQGLYLVTSTSTIKDGYVYATSAFMVNLPMRSTNENKEEFWKYDVTAHTKPSQTPEKANYRVVKVWSDLGYSNMRPKSIEITLWCDGKEYDTITLPTQDGKWFYIWEKLDTPHKWTVTEKHVTGYTTTGENEAPVAVTNGYSFTIKNTYTPPSGSKLPQTGQLWWPVPTLMAVGLLFIVVGLIRRKGSGNEK